MRTFGGLSRNRTLAGQLVGLGPSCILIAKTLAQKIGVPYHEDRIHERFLGHRPISKPGEPERPLADKAIYKYNGEITEVWPTEPKTGAPLALHEVEFITEEVWARDYWPNTADDPVKALEHLPGGKIEGMYYHGPTMTIVLLSPSQLKVGIRAASLIHPKMGPDKNLLLLLNEKLKKA